MRHSITYRGSTIWIAMIRENKDLAHETFHYKQRIHYIWIAMIRESKDFAHETLHYKQRIHYMDCYDQKEQGPRT